LGATLTSLSLIIDGLLPPGAPPFVLVVLSVATGLSTPPLAACVRALFPSLVTDPSGLPALFAFESTVSS
jgi:hypothetical protein